MSLREQFAQMIRDGANALSGLMPSRNPFAKEEQPRKSVLPALPIKSHEIPEAWHPESEKPDRPIGRFSSK